MAGGKDMMEELVKLLASMQAELKAAEDAMNHDGVIITLREAVADARGRLEMAEKALEDDLAYYSKSIEATKAHIEEIETQIIDTWDGEKRTVRYGAGLLKLRTTTSLKIHDKQEPRVLEDLLDHFNTPDEIVAYISSFNKTKLRAYMMTHPLPSEVAELVSKTTVKLEVESD